MKFLSFGKLFLLPLLSMAAILIGSAFAVSAFEARVVGVVATIAPKEASGLSCPESVEITDVVTTDFINVKDKNLIVATGGVLQAPAGEIRVRTRCDLLVMGGGAITANGQEGGRIRINVDFNVLIDGRIEADGADGRGGRINIRSDDGQLQLGGGVSANGTVGGRLRMNSRTGMEILGEASAVGCAGDGGRLELATDGNLLVTGELSAIGSVEGGKIELDAGGNAVLGGSSLHADGDQDEGGRIDLTADGDLTVDTLLTVQGAGEGGKIEFNAGGDADFSADSQLLADGLGGTAEGGKIEGVAVDTLTARGLMSATGADDDGKIDLTACVFDTTGAVFDPPAAFTTICPSVSLLSGDLENEPPAIATPENNSDNSTTTIEDEGVNDETIGTDNAVETGTETEAPSTDESNGDASGVETDNNNGNEAEADQLNGTSSEGTIDQADGTNDTEPDRDSASGVLPEPETRGDANSNSSREGRLPDNPAKERPLTKDRRL